jgi:hypothetical protein
VTTNYILIYKSPNGEIYIENIDPTTLSHDLVEGEYGDDYKFLGALPSTRNADYWPIGMLLIKGEIVVPRTVEVITKVEIP